ncbi:PadR family transcriptional regulator [Streptomyces alkaliphilus]|uniref:PadR family transcriptional regulator n=1 Tax=Streptomyces alkaliphilus TaxID=1472722 RepID=A0A7W3TF80_9ACTN|nr:PadR family transcriptional regulator [Streptomyces alkaliphilus]MBB0245749.1 PadR family transcriptional regulator [Streptomyces alkaliphilus]
MSRTSERALQEPTLLVLTALADEPRHGYAITREVKTLSDGRVVLRTGTLYGALDRLLRDGLIEVSREEIVDGRARKVYALAAPGRERLAVEAERLAATAREARRRLEASGPAGAPA